jgi:hypothetical protein
LSSSIGAAQPSIEVPFLYSWEILKSGRIGGLRPVRQSSLPLDKAPEATNHTLLPSIAFVRSLGLEIVHDGSRHISYELDLDWRHVLPRLVIKDAVHSYVNTGWRTDGYADIKPLLCVLYVAKPFVLIEIEYHRDR